MVYPGRMADTSHALSTSVLKERLQAAFPSLLEELTQLVAIPSVSSDPAHAADVERSAEHIRERFAALGLQAKVLRETAEDGTEGQAPPSSLTRLILRARRRFCCTHTTTCSLWASSTAGAWIPTRPRCAGDQHLRPRLLR